MVLRLHITTRTVTELSKEGKTDYYLNTIKCINTFFTRFLEEPYICRFEIHHHHHHLTSEVGVTTFLILTYLLTYSMVQSPS